MKLVILDRDGVINLDSDQFIKSPAEWQPIPGSLEAIARLNQADYRVVVATNQSGIGRGLFDMPTLNAIHDKMHKACAMAGARIDAVFFCPHTADSRCHCRKPNPGMLEEIAARYNIKLTGVPVVGDSLRDLQPAAELGARPYLVLTGKGRKTQAAGGLPDGTPVFADLASVVAELLRPSHLD
ncbi:MAG TPA: D-glycero-beta-D-manno-heptose-1,7-bisphosphate 7-phosphatase [Gallionella sp.]|jgi:D-glycero-D-manno-heptose 1,7-bisphosphate phosphatase|nr:D-glycero-beta-D-manno-heptose 1,7-bisphosphate 7-phosphatase [Gallionella sp.]OGS67218.1 MAG: D-glycero-beta-D-manno-heptose-1,7-bisphosphate 7-phosphatase [Gallionellales bacterium GWA2_54_124]OGT20212.1 MAG: D-glycero-beta-D-manno-heptose-1,7-bisphosphate 7-phosphatase [Gallionellales bacterium RIFOXYD12_FULL_53_10]HCI52012.1 D-glycero-beta-D-manno-heptose-1,7-bisphosphate 7-phosphatase [Gallionella sp.]